MDNEGISAFGEEEIHNVKNLLFNSVLASNGKIIRNREGKTKHEIDVIICI